jgi:hypothetical protein
MNFQTRSSAPTLRPKITLSHILLAPLRPFAIQKSQFLTGAAKR